jgi:hypothetical protein
MTLDQVRQRAPSVFATTAHESRSARFAPVPTINILEGFLSRGWSVHNAVQSRCRNPGKAPFTKHAITLRRDDAEVKVGGLIPQVMLVNANDGSSLYDFLGGLFRLFCLNGLVAPTGLCESVKVRHTGSNIMERVIEGSFRVLNSTDRAITSATEMGAIQLSEAEQVAFAHSAARLRWDPATQPVNVSRLLDVRRSADEGNDLWTVFNRVQESVVGGGQRYRSPTGRRVSAREVKGIDQSIGLNQALWTLAEEMKRIKTAV